MGDAQRQEAVEQEVRYQPDEQPPRPLAAGLAIQYAALSLASMVVTVLIVVRSAGLDDDYLSWAVFAALIVSGLTTMLQTTRRRRLGSGHLLLMGPSAAYIAVSITALNEGGPALLATLVMLSCLPLFRIASGLSNLRRLITPTVSSTIIMLIPVTLAPVIFDLFAQTPPGTPPAAAPLAAGVTLAAMMILTLRTRGVARVWAPVVGVVCGCMVGVAFGTYDVQRVLDADWIGLPRFSAWPGLDFAALRYHIWLLPSFTFLALVGAIETVGDAIAIQRVSWRRPRATDYKLVQGAVATDGIGNLLSGLLGTRLTMELDTAAIKAVDEFVVALAHKRGWSESAMDPPRAACEEVILSLKGEDDPFADDPELRLQPRNRLRVSARVGRELAELEFIAASTFGNMEDEIATLGAPTASSVGAEMSLRLLRHYASTVRHQKFRNADVVTITVKRRCR